MLFAYAGRGLLVHSADWTAPTVTTFDAAEENVAHYEIVRRFGYGVPNLERAVASERSSLALVAQAEVQPCRIAETASSTSVIPAVHGQSSEVRRIRQTNPFSSKTSQLIVTPAFRKILDGVVQ